MMSFAERINAASAKLQQLGGKFTNLNMQTPPQTQSIIKISVNTNDMAILEKLKTNFAYSSVTVCQIRTQNFILN